MSLLQLAWIYLQMNNSSQVKLVKVKKVSVWNTTSLHIGTSATCVWGLWDLQSKFHSFSQMSYADMFYFPVLCCSDLCSQSKFAWCMWGFRQKSGRNDLLKIWHVKSKLVLNTLRRQAKTVTSWEKLDSGTAITQGNFEAKPLHGNGDFGQHHIVHCKE